MTKYAVTVTFEVEVEDEGFYPDAEAVRRMIHEGLELPGYMAVGAKVSQRTGHARKVA